MQDLRAVGIHGRAGFAGVEPSLVDFGDVRDDVDFGPSGLSEELRETMEDLVVRDRLERPFVLHVWNIGRVFSTSRIAAYWLQTGWLDSERRSRGLRRRLGSHDVFKMNM